MDMEIRQRLIDRMTWLIERLRHGESANRDTASADALVTSAENLLTSLERILDSLVPSRGGK